MKVLITGAKGQLGIDLVNSMSSRHEVFGMGREELDISNLDSVIKTVNGIHPDIIINLAAYNYVDRSEKEIEVAYKVNSIGAKNLAIAALEYNSRLMHISTDYVYDGEKGEPYIELDRENPLNVYGKSKLAGDTFVKQICSKHYILRTSWLFGKNRGNFVKTILNIAKDNQTIKVVDDQIGSPTYVIDLISVIENIIKTDAYGTYHVSNEGECSWFQFAKKILELSNIEDVEVIPISTEESNRLAKRPKYSALNNFMLKLQFDYNLRNWQEALEDYFNE